MTWNHVAQATFAAAGLIACLSIAYTVRSFWPAIALLLQD